MEDRTIVGIDIGTTKICTLVARVEDGRQDEMAAILSATSVAAESLDRKSTFFLELENDPALIDPMIELVKQSVARIRLCDFTGQLHGMGNTVFAQDTAALYRVISW